MSAWADGPAELGPDREFSFGGLRWQLWGTPVVLLAAAVNIGFPLWVWLNSRAILSNAGSLAGSRWELVFTIMLWAVVVVASVHGFLHNLRLARQGLVLVSRVGVAFTDGRGRQRRVFWRELVELRIVAPLSGVNLPFGRLDLRTVGDRLGIPYGLTRADWEALRDLILTQAGLSAVTRKWWGVIYTRPDSSALP